MINHSTFHNSSDAECSCLEGSYTKGLGLEGSDLRKFRFKMLRPCLTKEDLTSDLKACVLGRLVLRWLIFRGPFWWSVQIYPKVERQLIYCIISCGIMWGPYAQVHKGTDN
ncbi:hypothetical protein QJS10_CPB12g01722 [Acorus calamus]|uniref:Uncharacterized protein n=1 Tax=Acorus calamus TaxID=4465 RepID=A0AAV9DP80_ACOCL|nr:hypothetical protein QJS10_CPB12g01722 [Acorus calamus]